MGMWTKTLNLPAQQILCVPHPPGHLGPKREVAPSEIPENPGNTWAACREHLFGIVLLEIQSTAQ